MRRRRRGRGFETVQDSFHVMNEDLSLELEDPFVRLGRFRSEGVVGRFPLEERGRLGSKRVFGGRRRRSGSALLDAEESFLEKVEEVVSILSFLLGREGGSRRGGPNESSVAREESREVVETRGSEISVGEEKPPSKFVRRGMGDHRWRVRRSRSDGKRRFQSRSSSARKSRSSSIHPRPVSSSSSVHRRR